MRPVTIKSKVNYRKRTTGSESWISRAKQIVDGAPNADWQKYGYKQLPGVYDVPVRGYNAAYEEILIGTAKAVAFEWLERGGGRWTNSFVGFLVAELNGMLEAMPIINLDGVMTDESIIRSTKSVAGHFCNRVCPACGKTDTIRRGRRINSCRCGYRESAL